MASRRRRYDNFTIDCGSDDFAEVISGYMEEHCYDIDEESAIAAADAGNKAARLLRERSRKRKGRGGGAYASDWVAEAAPSETGVEVVVHNRRHYQLTHLLEKGHAIANQYGQFGGRVAGDGIIEQIADEVSGEFEGRFVR